MKRRAKPKSRRWMRCAAFFLLLALAVGTFCWCRWVYAQIEHYAGQDQADQVNHVDAIAVFGAAEYDGRPSPVYRARLDHARALFGRGLAPLVITLGGNGGDQYSEGAVGREYLMSLGVPESAIIAETESRNTEESARRIAVIARANNLRRLVIVSDGVHLFRIHEICAANGLDVLLSPRPRVAVESETNGAWQEATGLTHEILSYSAWRLYLH